jgi:hypothetical protein
MTETAVSQDDAAARAAFREKLESLRFNFVGGGRYGRSTFNDATIADRQREATQHGGAEPIGSRWV